MSDGAGVGEDLVIVAALGGLVAEEMDSGILDTTGPLRLVLQVLQAVSLVPAVGEDVEGDLTADGEAGGFRIMVRKGYKRKGGGEKERARGGEVNSRQAEVSKLLTQLLNEGLTNLVLKVVLLVIETLLVGGVTADRRDVDHAVPELDESAALVGDVEVGDVV